MVRLFLTEDDVHGLAPSVQLVEQVGQVAVCIRTHHKVNQLLFVKKLLADALGHTAQDANLEFGILSLQGVELVEAVAHGLLCLFANRARIQ